jgi:hypothetical protein
MESASLAGKVSWSASSKLSSVCLQVANFLTLRNRPDTPWTVFAVDVLGFSGSAVPERKRFSFVMFNILERSLHEEVWNQALSTQSSRYTAASSGKCEKFTERTALRGAA